MWTCLPKTLSGRSLRRSGEFGCLQMSPYIFSIWMYSGILNHLNQAKNWSVILSINHLLPKPTQEGCRLRSLNLERHKCRQIIGNKQLLTSISHPPVLRYIFTGIIFCKDDQDDFPRHLRREEMGKFECFWSHIEGYKHSIWVKHFWHIGRLDSYQSWRWAIVAFMKFSSSHWKTCT